jgi:glycosyltransferase involved in cell wall biosynthesis
MPTGITPEKRVLVNQGPDIAVEHAPTVVLLLHSSDDLYGADIILLQIVRGLDPTRFKPLVILPDDMRHVGLLTRELAAAGIESMHLPIAIVRRRYLKPSGWLPLANKLIRGTWALRKLVRQRNVRIIHGFTLAVASAPLLAIVTRVPLVMHAHEILLRPRILRKLLHALGVRFSKRVLCVSGPVRANILEDEAASADRIQVVHNGIPAVPAPTRSIAELRAELGVPLDRPLVGMIGRVSPWKGQLTFLEAAALVRQTHPECHFIAIGGVFDNETQHLDRMMELHSRLNLQDTVTIAGFRKDARDMIFAFDIFVLPSTSPDPLPTVVLEAMSAGRPVIAAAHGGALEMVVKGETGLLVPPADPSALSDAISTLLDDPNLRQRMGAAGRSRMLTKFELSRYLEQIQQIYDLLQT